MNSFDPPMMGVIEVHDRLVVAWRDYFDLSQFTSSNGRGGADRPGEH